MGCIGKMCRFLQSDKKPCWLDVLKMFFEAVVIIVMLLMLNAALKANKASQAANKITFDALQSRYVPWVAVTKVEPPLVTDANNFIIAIECKNFSNAPALNFGIKYNLLGEKMRRQKKLYESDVLMPNQESKTGGYAMVRDGRARQIVDKLHKGESAFEFIISYEDIFGRRIKVRQVRRWSFGGFRNTAYEVEFLD